MSSREAAADADQTIPSLFTMPAVGFLAVLAALTPSALAQANTSYVDYSKNANPDLTAQCLATVHTSFPDCSKGPLSRTLVCDPSATPHDRAAALVSMFT